MSVAAVVVTFNRKQLLMECMAALLSQTQPIDKLILVDNASTDGTADLLAEQGWLAHPRVEYVRMSENTGGAGGFSHGVKCGFEGGYDWLWLMDDDAEPAPDALEKLLPYMGRNDVSALANFKVGKDGVPQYGHLGWFDHRAWSRHVITPVTAAQVTDQPLEVEHSAFVGLVVPRRAIEKIGLPRADFFIHYDDCEYCYRLSRIAPILLVPGSVINHKDARQVLGESRTSLGKTQLRVPLQRLWLNYYHGRNKIAVKRELLGPAGFLFFVAMELCIALRVCLGILRYDDHKWRRIHFQLACVVDGFRNVFDNDKPKAILYAKK